jgi:hypothetical protein
LSALAAAVQAGEITIEGDAVRVPRRKPAPTDPRVESARRGMTAAMGIHEPSAVMIEVDRLTRFSWKLLGRPARSEKELVTLYGGLLGLGSDLSVAELARMIPSVDADSLGQMVLRLEADKRLRAANETVLGFMRHHPVASLWGRGLNASADMMSLEATRYLWSARLDPRRRTFAIGTYAHVLDQWGVLYDQPIVLNRRQAGAAIEGALRQKQVDHLEKVAVDTHGHSHFGMTLAKVVGFDLTPRLARLKTRKLHLPTGFAGAVLRRSLRRRRHRSSGGVGRPSHRTGPSAGPRAPAPRSHGPSDALSRRLPCRPRLVAELRRRAKPALAAASCAPRRRQPERNESGKRTWQDPDRWW